MPTTGARKAKQVLPKSATIVIQHQVPRPNGMVEVSPEGGRVHFENKDKDDYRLRLRKPKSDPNTGLDLFLPAGGRVTVLIKKDDEFDYSIMGIGVIVAADGHGGGPIRN
jgi:hypothetical protein